MRHGFSLIDVDFYCKIQLITFTLLKYYFFWEYN